MGLNGGPSQPFEVHAGKMISCESRMASTKIMIAE